MEVQYESEPGKPARTIHYCIFFKGHKGPHLISCPSDEANDE